MSELTKKQLNILNKFIQIFLPTRGNQRKNSGNELDYVTATLDKLFIQNFGFNLSRHVILKAFKGLGNAIFEKEANFDYAKKKNRPADIGNLKGKTVGVGNIIEAPFTYIDISSDTIRHLMKTTAQLPENTNTQSLDKIEKLKSGIQEFKDQIAL